LRDNGQIEYDRILALHHLHDAVEVKAGLRNNSAKWLKTRRTKSTRRTSTLDLLL
jgi:hypothetical protein